MCQSIRTILFWTCLMLMTGSACSKQEAGAPPAALSAAPLPGVSGNGAEQTKGGVSVSIIPGSPTALTDLQAAHSGTGTTAYQWMRNGQIITGENSSRLAKNQFQKGDTISVAVTCGGTEGAASVVIGNSPPVVTSVLFGPEDIHAGVDITVKPVASDPDGDSAMFRYKWTVNNQEVPEDSPVLTGDHFKRGDKIAISVVPFDRDSDGPPFVSRPLVIPNAAPRIVSNPPPFHGEIYTYQVVAEDADGDSVSYSLASSPPGMTIDAKTGLIRWQINQKSAGSHEIEIVARDPFGGKCSQKFTLTMSVTEGEGK